MQLGCIGVRKGRVAAPAALGSEGPGRRRMRAVAWCGCEQHADQDGCSPALCSMLPFLPGAWGGTEERSVFSVLWCLKEDRKLGVFGLSVAHSTLQLI